MRNRLGLPVPVMILLAALATIRVVPHDLDIVSEGSFVALLLVFVPLAIWLAVVLWWQIPHPLLTLTVIGIAYGVMLGIGHQLLWEARWNGNPPHLGDNLEGALAPGLESIVFRISAFLSSVITGTIVGAIVGLVAQGIERLRRT